MKRYYELKDYIISSVKNNSLIYKEQVTLYLFAKIIGNILCTDNEDLNSIISEFREYEYDFSEEIINETTIFFKNYHIEPEAVLNIFTLTYKEDKERKKYGEYYTPSYIVDLMKMITEKYTTFDNKVIYDFASGNGSIVSRLILGGVKPRKVVANDIQNYCVFLTKINVLLVSHLKKRKVETNIFCADSILDNIDDDIKYDIIISNPPYIGQQYNASIFHKIREHDFWKNYYKSKSDYLYYFIIYGIEKLEREGIMCLITTRYWLTATNADVLRRYIVEKCDVLEIHDFNQMKLFDDAQGQESVIIILRIKSDVNVNVRYYQYNPEWFKSHYNSWEKILVSKINNDKEMFLKQIIFKQDRLSSDPWYFDEKVMNYNTKVKDYYTVQPGIQTGADRVSIKNKYVKLHMQEIEQRNIKLGSGIYVLSKEDVEDLNLTEKEKKVIKPFIKSMDLTKMSSYYKYEQYLIYAEEIEDISDYPMLLNHLQRFYEILDARYCTYSLLNQKKAGMWWKLVGARTSIPYEGEKILLPARSKNIYFVYSNSNIYASMDIYYIYGGIVSLKFLAAYLNSDVVVNYIKEHTKTKGEKYEMYKEPIDNLPFPTEDILNEFKESLKDIIGEYTANAPINSKEYQYHKATGTWVKNIGLFDKLMETREYILSLMQECKIYVDFKIYYSIDELSMFPKEMAINFYKLLGANSTIDNNYWLIKKAIDNRIFNIWQRMIKGD